MIYPAGFKGARVILLAACILFSFQTTISATDTMENRAESVFTGIVFKNGLLKVSVEKQHIKEVLKDISQKTGITITAKYLAHEEITAHIDFKPLEEGLKDLFAGKSYVFFYASENSPHSAVLSSVLILPAAGKQRTDDAMVQIEKEFPDTAIQANETKVPKGLVQNKEDLTKEINEAIKSLQGKKDFNNQIQIGDDSSREDTSEIVNEVLEGIKNQKIQSTLLDDIQKHLDNSSDLSQ